MVSTSTVIKIRHFSPLSGFFKKNVIFFNFFVDIISMSVYNTSCVTEQKSNGVWLSLARVPDLGSGGRRFESCHPDFVILFFVLYKYMRAFKVHYHAGVVQW